MQQKIAYIKSESEQVRFVKSNVKRELYNGKAGDIKFFFDG